MAIADPIRDITDYICDCVQDELGTEWSKIKYLEDLDLNNNFNQNRVFGIRALEAIEVEGVHKFVTLDQQFELVMIRSKFTKASGDSEIVELSYDNRRDALCVYKKLARTSLNRRALLVDQLVISEPEFIESGKIVVQRITFTIKHRCEL